MAYLVSSYFHWLLLAFHRASSKHGSIGPVLTEQLLLKEFLIHIQKWKRWGKGKEQRQESPECDPVNLS